MEEELLSTFLREATGASSADFLDPVPLNQIQLGRLADIEARTAQEGTFLVNSHYLTLLNALRSEEEDLLFQGVRIVRRGLQKLREELGQHGEAVENFDAEEVNLLRRGLAILAFLTNKALVAVDGKLVQQVMTTAAGTKASKGGKKGVNWKDLRATLIEDLQGILELPVEKIWDDTGYGYSVPRVLIRAVSNSFNEYLAKDGMRGGTEACKILGIFAKRFGKKDDVYSRVYPLIKYGEDVAKLVSRTVQVLVQEYKIEDAVPQAFQIITNIVETQLEGPTENASKNLQLIEKGVASIINDLCELTPEEVIGSSFFYLFQLLTVDSVQIRSAVVQGASSLIRYLSSTASSEVERIKNCSKLRRQILSEILVAHAHDTAAIVRAKSLTVMCKLSDEGHLDPTENAICFDIAIDRLMDGMVLPRKYAMALINTIVNRFAPICTDDIDYKKEVDVRRRKLLELLAKKSLKRSYYVSQLVTEFTEQAQANEIELSGEEEEEYGGALEEGMPAVRTLISGLLKDEKYWEACTVLYHAFERYGSGAGIDDAGKKSANTPIYLSYFKNLTLLDSEGSPDTDMSQHSLLSDSLDLSRGVQQGNSTGVLEHDEVTAARDCLKLSQGCLKMKTLLNPLMDKLTMLLQIGTQTDRTEVINCIGMLVKFKYKVTEKVTGPTIQAIASLGKDSAKSLVSAFWDIFIIGGNNADGMTNVAMIKTLFKILDEVNIPTRELLRPIIGEMYVSGSLPNGAVRVLWDAFRRSYNTWTLHDSKNAVFVLGAIGRVDKAVITANIRNMVETGLSDEAVEEDMEIVRYTLEAILYSLRSSQKGESDVGKTQRLPKDHPLFSRVLDILRHGVTKQGNWDTHHQFPRVAEVSLQIFYRLSWDYRPFVKHLLKTIPAVVFNKGEREDENGNPEPSEILGSEEIYLRFMAIMTSLLGSHINYCETVVIPELKRRSKIASLSNNRKGGRPNESSSSASRTEDSNSSLGKSLNDVSNVSGAADSSKRSEANNRKGKGNKKKSNSSAVNAMAEMEAIIGNSGFDSDIEQVKAYVEKLLDQGAFQQFRRLTLFFCQKVNQLQHKKLKLVVVSALAKLMLVGPESVNKLIEPFINLFNTIDDNKVKAEVLKQLTILNVRFPNQVEKCNVIIKNGLMNGDTDLQVACLDFLGYLALGDMVKIRDCISEVALCLNSDKDVIRDLAKDFFNVCAEKDNVISNAVPEVISHLSQRNDLEQENFQTIMKYLLVRVKKEKQVLGLVDTLVARFKGPASNDRMCEDTAFCLAQLPHGEKTFKIIHENFKNYTDKLGNEAVYRSFHVMLDAWRKGTAAGQVRPEFRAKLDDYEKELDEWHEKNAEKNRIANAGQRQQKRRRVSETSEKDRSSLLEGNADHDDEGPVDEEQASHMKEDNDDEEEQNVSRRKEAKGAAKKKDDDDAEEEEQTIPKQPGRKGETKKEPEDDDDDAEEQDDQETSDSDTNDNGNEVNSAKEGNQGSDQDTSWDDDDQDN